MKSVKEHEILNIPQVFHGSGPYNDTMGVYY
jgi:hypothetical protein